MMNLFYSGSPVIERTDEVFVEHITVAGERRRVEFTKPILWLQESDTQLRFMHGGKVFEEGCSRNDWYGYLTSIDSALDEALNVASHFTITAETSLEVQLVTTVAQRPVTETDETRQENSQRPATYRKTYCDVPDSWRKEVVENGEKLYPSLKSRVLEQTVTWSSKNTPEQNTALAEALRKRWPKPDTAT